MKFYSFKILEEKFYNKDFLDVISKINYNISIEKADVYQLELLGVCYLKLDFTDNALTVFKHIKVKYPKYDQVNINYATALRKKGFIDEAIKIYNVIIKENPNNHDALNNIAVAYELANNFVKAINFYRKAIKINKYKILYYINLAKTLTRIKKNRIATRVLFNALKIASNKDEIKSIIASHFINNCNKVEEGESIYKNLIKKKTSDINAYHNYAYYLQNKNIRFDYSTQLLNKCISLNENFYPAYNTLGIIYYKKGFLNKAIKFYERSYKLNSNFDHVQHNLAVAYIKNLTKLNTAWELRETKRLNDFSFYKNFPKKIWNGNYVEKLYIWNEQGIGDEILFLNTVHLASLYVKKVTVHLNYRILSFYKNFLELQKIKNVKLLPLKKHDILKKNYQIKKSDKHISMASLPKFFLNHHTKFQNLSFPYIINNKNNEVKDNKIKIGLSWKTTNLNEQHRNLNLRKIRTVLINKNYSFYNLQFGKVDEELKFFKKNNVNFNINKKINYMDDFNYITNLINNMDIVITIQNTIAHLCGSMNKKFIITLENHCRFNWGGSKHYTPWYPSAYVIRNNTKDYFKDSKKISKLLDTAIKKTLNI